MGKDSSAQVQSEATRSWGETIAACFQGRVLSMLFLGFSAGLPILLIFSSLSLWLRDAGVARSTVTFFSWAALGYSFKFVWAPLVDRLPLPVLTNWLGRRRSWLLVSQLAIVGAMIFMALHNPQDSLVMMALGAVLLGFSSATQDIVIDAYRIEAADSDLQALMSSAYIAGYRVGMLAAGAGALALASWFGAVDGAPYNYTAWSYAYLCMAALMLVGIITTFSVREPEVQSSTHKYGTVDYLRFVGLFAVATAVFVAGFIVFGTQTGVVASLFQPLTGELVAAFLAEALRLILSAAGGLLAAWFMVRLHIVSPAMVDETYVAPFRDFFSRFGRLAIIILLLVGTFRISDIVMGAVANVFYDDMGYTKQQIATITKTFGLFMTIAGGFLGGILAIRYGVMKSLWLGAFLAAVSNLLFALLAVSEPQSWMLAGVIAADNLSGGLASAAFVAYLSGLTNRAFTAMQYAVFSSLMTLLPKLLAGYSGTAVDAVGYPTFFIGSALIGLPVLFLVGYLGRHMSPKS
ncbi:AmpG family muropeptide MFS transporter [Parendozoicomonas haliclonae]|uniref:Muropeptide transporter n=1 Tax=Parendozoicomonas haliclonae TaxID=1960125 RepID=A0A1X7AE22_9GAMM|nr:MFS transporter [Parendozoicomonas haliclonae]SMA31864.1 muropeptide transporter [Parendozoicomonas haliclonae]